MLKKNADRAKERMIHVRLDERTHRELKILAAETDATVQSVVEDLIKRRVAENHHARERTNQSRGE
jgi:predicted HicB family RNase H-like nuclease